MKGTPLRFVLAVYGAGQGDPEVAFKALRSAGAGKTFLFDADADLQLGSQLIERYSRLRLDGECLVAVEVKPPEVEEVVKQLQNTGSPAVFVLHQEIAIGEIASGSAAVPEP